MTASSTGKIFGIGLGRTGTTSLTKALRLLGFTAIHFPTSLDQINKHDAATDITVTNSYKKLDTMFPGSKFILTMRERDDWLNSCENYWRQQESKFDQIPFVGQLRQAVYGTTVFNRQHMNDVYAAHERSVRQHFEKRLDDVLFINFCGSEERWANLCTFLNVAEPNLPFPHHNRTDSVDHLLKVMLSLGLNAHDIARGAEITPQYLEHLQKSLNEPGLSKPIGIGSGHEYGTILEYMCRTLGGADNVARLLKVDRGTILRQISEAN
jgi:hypothetical protein